MKHRLPEAAIRKMHDFSLHHRQMTPLKVLREWHVVERLGGLRAAVLGANDGVLSTSSLMIGVASAQGNEHNIFIAGVSGLVAGAMSMAMGEYVSVGSQAVSKTAELSRERQEQHNNPVGEDTELALIYVNRGLPQYFSAGGAKALRAQYPLAAHAGDAWGHSMQTAIRPVQAAISSAATFAMGAIVPVALALIAPIRLLVESVSIASLVILAALAAIGARIGDAPMGIAAIRVMFWGAFAMAATAGVGTLFSSPI
jgi:VIT1/CCC1 family predicted Fe2+/Mn2+ transporter